MKKGDLLQLKGTGPTRVVWCDSPSGQILDSAFFPPGTAALFVDFSRRSASPRRGDLLFVLVGGRGGLVWSDDVEAL